MAIMLADKSLRIPMGLVKNASIRVGANIFPIDFVVVDMPIDYSCPIIFGRTKHCKGGHKLQSEYNHSQVWGREMNHKNISPAKRNKKSHEKVKGSLSPS
jgi:hypothetical protein